MRTKTILLLLFAAVLGMGMKAQPIAAEEALSNAEKRFRALETYACTVNFEVGGTNHKDAGKVYYQGAKYHFDYPEDQTIFDGTNIMNWSKAFASVDFMAPQDGPDFSLGGLYRLHRERYRFEWSDTNGTAMKMTLTAKDDGMAVARATISLDKASGLISAYTLLMGNGFTILYDVPTQQINPALDPKLFSIDWDFVKRVQNGEVPPVEHTH